jgi:hypothetical protein
VIGQGEMRKLVKSKLTDLQKTSPNELFTPEYIQKNIEDKIGDAASVADVEAILREQWGSGIEPVTVGGRVWKFGPGKPPVSRQI